LLKDGDLLLIDAGCEYELYASDITRTYPINGKFSDPQKIIYELVLEAQKAAIAKVTKGNAFDQPHKAALDTLVQGLIDLEFCQGSVDKVIEEKLYQKFFMHRTSHWLGLDVHDVGDYVDDNDKSIALSIGNVLTIEPGIYVSPSKTIPKEFWGIGIRIEDDVVVGEKTPQILSINAPKEVNELENLIGSFGE
jgi:Xaa-Pro aminopeptidase